MANEIAPQGGSPPATKSKTPNYDALKGRQKRFVEEYVIDLNGTAAAKRAGYSHASAAETACESLRKSNIALAVEELITQRTGVTKTWIVDELAKDAQTSMGDFATWGGGSVAFKQSEDLTEDQMRRVKKISYTWGKSNSLSIELADRQAALFKLADAFGVTKPVADPKGVGDTYHIGQAVFTRAPVVDRDTWEERMKSLAEERAREDLKLIEGGKA